MTADDDVAAMSCDEAQPLVRDAIRDTGDAGARRRVLRHLEGCPGCRALADEERALDRLLEQHLPQYAAPLALKRRLQARLPPEAAPRRRRWWAPVAVAAAVAIVLVVLLPRRGPGADPLVAEAVTDHLRVTHRERSVDVEGGGPHRVRPWFTGRLDFALPAVFGGDDAFTLVGGSVGYFLDRQAAVLVYKRQLHSISLFVFPAAGLALPAPDQEMGRVRSTVRQSRGFSVVLWRDGDLGQALVSDVESAELLRLGAAIAGAR